MELSIGVSSGTAAGTVAGWVGMGFIGVRLALGLAVAASAGVPGLFYATIKVGDALNHVFNSWQPDVLMALMFLCAGTAMGLWLGLLGKGVEVGFNHVRKSDEDG